MTKSELIDRIAGKQTQLSSKDVELSVKAMIEYIFHFTTEFPGSAATPRLVRRWI